MLLPFISEKFNGAIWRMEIDNLSPTVFVEIRNSEKKEVSFSSVSLLNDKLNFKDITTPERWLTGIEAAYNGVLLLHNYLSENSPVHKGLTAIDAVNSEILWSNYTYAFNHLSANGAVLYNVQIQPKKLFLADIKTGMPNGAYLPEVDTELINDIITPRILPISFLDQLIEIKPHGNSLHYLEYNNFRIVSLHSFEAGQLKQHLYIMNGLQIVYEDIMNSDIQKVQPEAFILHKNWLIYIKNKSELKVISL
ncbi:MAG TPA: DUF4905 domain-containing protein [Mucilaginibacter sp.]